MKTLLNIAVVGASPKPNRYSYMAMETLIECGFNPVPVSPTASEILGRKSYRTLTEIPNAIDTVTMYVSPVHQTQLIDAILNIKPRRVIFNPGTENSAAYSSLKQAGIEVLEACTLILLRSGQF